MARTSADGLPQAERSSAHGGRRPRAGGFVRRIERAFAADVHAAQARGPDRDLAPEHVRFLAGVLGYCRVGLFARPAKIARAAAPGLEQAWRYAGDYLDGSLGDFDLDRLAQAVGEDRKLPLAGARKLLDAALLQRLADFYRPGADAATRARALKDLIAIGGLARTPWLGRVVAFENALRQDPSGVYPRMDAASQEACRDRVAGLAARWRIGEDALVAQALSLARQARSSPGDHVGYYLLDEGIDALRAACGAADAPATVAGHPIWCYQGLHAGLVALLLAAVAVGANLAPTALALAYLSLIALIGGDSLKATVELLLGRAARARAAPALDFVEHGLPEHESVLIAVPMHLIDIAQWNRALDTARWNLTQANDTHIALVFLTDFADSAQPHDTAAERALLAHALATLSQPTRGLDGRLIAVHLLHRDREFVARQACWMGRERKRGKLQALNRLIAARDDRFSAASADARAACRSAKYVLCLDEDSRLARNSAQRMAGFLAHPLNRPRLEGERIRAGHGLAVPCTMTAKESLSTWRWPRFSVGPSVDTQHKPGAVRNFMYDWFGQAPYSGKGMYEPHWFETLCEGRLAEGEVLSHDTAEAAWLRPGYVDRALVTDAYPASFRSFVDRQDRWIRGDLQNAALALRALWRPARERPGALAYFTLAWQLHAWLSNAAVCAVCALMIAAHAPAGWWWGAAAATMIGGYQRLLVNGWRDRSLPARQLLRIYVPYFFRIHLAQLLRLAASALYAAALARAAALTGWRLATGRRLLQWRSAAAADADRAPASLFAGLAWPVALLAMLALTALGLESQRGADPVALVVLGLWTLTPALNRILTRSD